MEVFESSAVEAYVVRRPAGTELVAAHGQLADEIGQAVVVRIASGLSAQDCHDVVGWTRLEIKNSRTSLRLSTKP